MRHPARVQRRHLAPDRLQEVVVERLRVELVEARPVDVFDDEHHRLVRQLDEPFDGWAGNPGAGGEEQEERLVLDVVGE